MTLKKDPVFYGGLWNSKVLSLPSSLLIFTTNIPVVTISFSIFLSHSKTSLCPLNMSLGFEDKHQSIVATCNKQFIKQQPMSVLGEGRRSSGRRGSGGEHRVATDHAQAGGGDQESIFVKTRNKGGNGGDAWTPGPELPPTATGKGLVT